MRWWAVLGFLCFLGLSCTRDVDAPKSYGVGEGRGSAVLGYGSANVGFHELDPEEDGKGSPTDRDAVAEDVPRDPGTEPGEDTISCVGSEKFCQCMDSYAREDYCECVDSPQGNTTLYCECTIMICGPNPDEAMTLQYQRFCNDMFPAQCGHF